MKEFPHNLRERLYSQGVWKLMKALLLACIILCTASLGRAQQFVTNSATVSSGGNAFPFNSTSDEKVELTYLPSDFKTTPKNGYIKTLYFRFTGTINATYTNFLITMAQTTSSLSGTTFFTPTTTVLSASSYTVKATSSGVWVAISLKTPFLYDAKKTLVVQVSHTGYSGTGSSIGYISSSSLPRHRIYGYKQTDLTGVGSDAEMYDFGMDISPAGNNNAGVTTLVAPVAFCPGTYNVIVKAANLGQNALSSVQIGWSFDGVSQTPVTWSNTIPSGRDTDVTLGSKSFASNVVHTLKVWTYNPNSVKDTIPDDDTLYVNSLVPAVSGTFTINPGGGTGGTNFTSFSSAVNFINSAGICGPVLFKVASGTYNEQVSLEQVNGTSSTNTITFDGGDSSKTIITSSGGSYPATFRINGTNYVTLKRMSIINTSTAACFAVHITSGSSYNTVTNCIVRADTNTTTSGVVALGMCGSSYSTADGANHNTINNCWIKGGYINISCYGSGSTALNSGNTVTGCWLNRASQYGIYWYYQRDYKIAHNNLVMRPVSATSSYGIYSIYSASCSIDGNKISANYMPCLWEYVDYSVTGGISYFTNNMLYGQYYPSGGYTSEIYYALASKVYHNTFYNTLPSSGYVLYLYNNGTLSQGTDVRDNIFVRAGSSNIYNIYIANTNYVSNLDYNDFYGVTGGNYAYFGSLYGDLASLAKANKNYNQNNVSVNPGFASTTYGSEDFHMCKTCYGVSGIYLGVDKDFDGDARCKLFPNMGADETLNGKGKPTVKFFITSNIYPNSPSYVYQIYKAGSPTQSSWYLQNASYTGLTKISDSTVLLTNKFAVGTNVLKLVVQTCGGADSFTQTFNLTAPTSVPGTDFVANKNSILVNDIVSFQDLTTYGPVSWNWSISPDSTISGGAKVPAIKYVYGSSQTQNPQIQFMYPGKYKVCLTTSNGVGKGAAVCKTDYITVLPSINIGAVKVVNDGSGYLFDDGGPNSAYTNNGGAPSTVIAPCADSVYLVFTMFDVNCNIGFVQLYEGTDAHGRRLDPCGGSGLNSGFTGGPTGAVCSAPCMPDITKPDTFKASKAMFIQMNDGSTSANAKGFAAYWWSTPSSSKKPQAGFKALAASGDSICVNANINFVNTSSTNNANDPVSTLWDLDGDPTTFECIGTCATAYWPYFLTGPVTVTLIASNCGGSDTFSKTFTVYNPKSPKTAIHADNTYPTTADVVFLTAPIAQCVDDYKWTITKSSGSGTGTAYYVGGTSDMSAAPQVTFSDTGYYDIKLYVDNLAGLQKDSLTVKKYIHVRNPYCIPSVATLNQGMGISKVTLNTLNNSTTQAQQEYTNFTSNQSLSTSLAVGATYPITVSRDANLLFENLNRSVFIDWNQDGSFTGKGEEADEDSNSNSVTWTGKITVPKTAKLGATIMRIAVNRGAYSNKPCGQNEFGEYQDYRIYVVPYNIAPVITLNGTQGMKDTIKIEQGNAFTEDGYMASSFLYGDMTAQVKRTSRKLGSSNPADSFNSVIPATYIFSYNVTDSVGNKAVTQYRVAVVYKDKTPPVLIIDQPDTTVMEVTSTPLTPFPAPKVISADDLVDGPLAASVVNDANKVTSNIVGFYTITYTVTDLSGNTANVYRYVKIIDTIKPVIKLLGANPVTLEVYNSYTDAGVTVSDNYYPAGTLNSALQIVSTVDTAHLGTYMVTYTLADPSGNKADAVTRTVIVADTIAPVITLNGEQTDSVEVFNSYDDPGVTIDDNYDKTAISVVVSGTYYSKFPKGIKPGITGSYTIIYTATDASGNTASITRTVKVQDLTPPVLKLNGPNTVTVCRWFNYTDAGYTVSDNYDKVSDIRIDTLNTGSTIIDGLYNLRYRGTDKSGNVGYSEYRFVLVKAAGQAGCTSGIEPGLGLDRYITVYPNPNAGIFSISATLPEARNVRITVNNILGEEVAVLYSGMLGSSTFRADLSGSPAGIYFLNVVSDSQVMTKKIEITR